MAVVDCKDKLLEEPAGLVLRQHPAGPASTTQQSHCQRQATYTVHAYVLHVLLYLKQFTNLCSGWWHGGHLLCSWLTQHAACRQSKHCQANWHRASAAHLLFWMCVSRLPSGTYSITMLRWLGDRKACSTSSSTCQSTSNYMLSSSIYCILSCTLLPRFIFLQGVPCKALCMHWSARKQTSQSGCGFMHKYAQIRRHKQDALHLTHSLCET